MRAGLRWERKELAGLKRSFPSEIGPASREIHEPKVESVGRTRCKLGCNVSVPGWFAASSESGKLGVGLLREPERDPQRPGARSEACSTTRIRMANVPLTWAGDVCRSRGRRSILIR